MRRHTIAGLMVVTLVVAIAFAALRDASDTWAGILLLLTFLLLGIAILGAVHRREGKRAFWQGFALFGWGYLTLSQGPWFADQVQPKLPTTRLLAYAHERLNPRDSTSAAVQMQLAGTLALVNGSPPPGATMTVQLAPSRAQLVNGATPTTSQSAVQSLFILLGTGNLEQFQRIGQCLFTLLAAITGAGIARWFDRTNRNGQVGA